MITEMRHPYRVRVPGQDGAGLGRDDGQGVPLSRWATPALPGVGRGNLDQARQALDKAGKTAPTNWPWESQQEFELLRREVENLITPPRMDPLPIDRP